MSMNLIRWEQQTVTPKHDSIQWDDGRCGALNGCEITHLGANKLRISSGYIVILGRLIEVSQTDVNCNVSTDGESNGQMFIRLDLGSDEPVEIVTEAAAVLTELTQDKNANYDNGIYELLLATYNISETTISNLSVKLPEIDSIGEEISSIEEDISELNNNLGQFSFGFTEDGKAGYKVGASTEITPFKSGETIGYVGEKLNSNASITIDKDDSLGDLTYIFIRNQLTICNVYDVKNKVYLNTQDATNVINKFFKQIILTYTINPTNTKMQIIDNNPTFTFKQLMSGGSVPCEMFLLYE